MIKDAKFLISYADPKNDLPYIEKEKSLVLETLRNMPTQNVDSLEPIKGTFQKIFETLKQNHAKDANFFHYCGHSSTEQIKLESVVNRENTISVNEFTTHLALMSNLEFVFLNSCTSENLGKALLDKSESLKVVIFTLSKVNDEAAFMFSKMFYNNLSKGYTIPEAYTICKGDFNYGEGDFSNTTYRDDLGTEEAFKTFPWQIEIKSGYESVVNDWRFVPKTIKNKLEDSNYNVLCLYPKGEGKNERIYRSIREEFFRRDALGINDKDKIPAPVELYSFNELEKSDKSNKTIDLFDTFLFFVSETFVSYWRENKHFIEPSLTAKKVGFIKLKDDAEKSALIVQCKTIKFSQETYIPNNKLGMDLIELIEGRKGYEHAMSTHCYRELLNLIFQQDLEHRLKRNIIHLNYVNQLGDFDPNINYGTDRPAKKFGAYNLIHIIGSPNCGQLLLVRKILNITGLYRKSHIEPKYNQVSKSIFKTLDEDTIWRYIAFVLSENVDKNQKLDKKWQQRICNKIIWKLEKEDQIWILDECDKLSIQDDKTGEILSSFWSNFQKELNEIGYKGTNKFFIFFIDRSHCFKTKASLDERVFQEDSIFLGKSLASISSIESGSITQWHGKSKEDLSGIENFNSLEKQENLNKLTEYEYMKTVAEEICKLMGLKDTSFITDLSK